jgi:hypothetical protein
VFLLFFFTDLNILFQLVLLQLTVYKADKQLTGEETPAARRRRKFGAPVLAGSKSRNQKMVSRYRSYRVASAWWKNNKACRSYWLCGCETTGNFDRMSLASLQKHVTTGTQATFTTAAYIT